MNGVEVVSSYFTPTVLFCVLNLMIITIFIRKPPTIKPPQLLESLYIPQIIQIPFIFKRIKPLLSIYLTDPQSEAEQYSTPSSPTAQDESAREYHKYDVVEEEISHVSRNNSDSNRKKSVTVSEKFPEEIAVEEWRPETMREESVREFDDCEETSHVRRNKSDTTGKEIKIAVRALKKSFSEKFPEEEEEEEDVRRPATMKEKTTEFPREDEAVDAKADDFINKFRQQLKLQRMDSILRYKEILDKKIGKILK